MGKGGTVHQVHFAAKLRCERPTKISQEAEIGETLGIRYYVDEEIDVALNTGISPGYRPKHTDVTRVMCRGSLEDLIPPRP